MPVKSKMRFFTITACVIVLLGFFSCQNNSAYSNYNNHEAAHFARKDGDPNLKQAQAFFNAKEYKKAAISFEKTEDLTNPEVQYFFAIALIETNHYKYAKLYLDNIKAGTSAYKNKAIWYLALSNLKQKKFDDCKNYLKQVPAGTAEYTKAQKLLKDLK